MTPGDPGLSDAELVPRVVGGDRAAFAEVYDRYADRLYDFAHSMLRNRDDAADAVADAFVTTAEKLSQLRDPARLRPWLYSVVRRECLARLRDRAKVAYGGEEDLVAMADDSPTPGDRAEQEELRTLVWDAAAGLAERDRAVLDLHLRHGLEGAELGEAMGVTANNAYVMLNRLRAQVERSLGALLIARLGRDDCPDLGGLLADWDGSFSPLVRKRVARHVDGCDVCARRRSSMVSPWTLLSGVPLLAAPVGLRSRVLDDPRLVAHGLGPAGAGGAGSLPPSGGDWRRSLLRGVTAALIVALLVALAVLVMIVWPDRVERTAVDPAAPVTSSPAYSPSVVPGTTVSPAPPTIEATTPETTPPARPSPEPTTAPPPTTSSPSPTRSTPNRPPRIGTIVVERVPSDCTVMVSAPIDDDGSVAFATADWATPTNGTGSAAMSPSGQVWSANLGGMAGGQDITVTVTAVDDTGQAASRTITTPLEYCVF